MIAKVICIVLLLPIHFYANAEMVSESISENNSTTPMSFSTCTVKQKEENDKILQFCEKNWETWGVTEKPPTSELLSTTKCSSGKENALNGCGQALMAIPALLGELAVVGLIKLTPEDKTSLSYISQYGTLQDMQAYYANKYLREKCKLGSDADDHRFIDSNCRKPSLEKIDCNPFLDEVRTAIKCRNSSETRRAYRQDEKQAVLAPAQKVYQDQQARKAAEIKYKNELAILRKTCGPIMNPYSESYTKMFFNPIDYLGTASTNFIKPDASTVAKYNQCLIDNSKNNKALQDELKKNGAGLVGALIGSIDSLKCYREDIQAQLKCEIALAVVSGGTAAGIMIAKKLGKKASKKLVEKPTFSPLTRPNNLSVTDVIKTDTLIQKELSKMGLQFSKDEAGVPYLKEIVDYGLMNYDGDQFGSILKITGLPKATGKGSIFSPALTHPEMASYLEKMKAAGYDLVIDTTMAHAGAGAYFHPLKKYIALGPNSVWSDFIHEYQHLEFNSFIEGSRLAEMVKLRSEGKRLVDALPSDVVSEIGVGKIKTIQKLIDKGVSQSNAINESLSTTAELTAMGWKQYVPSQGPWRYRYMLRHQITEIEALGDAMTPQQRRLVEKNKRAHKRSEVYEKVGQSVVTHAPTVVVVGSVGAGVLVWSDAIPSNEYIRIYYDVNGNTIGILADGSWEYIKLVKK